MKQLIKSKKQIIQINQTEEEISEIEDVKNEEGLMKLALDERIAHSGYEIFWWMMNNSAYQTIPCRKYQNE